MIKTLVAVFLAAILTENYVLSKFLGICPFLGVSKKLGTATGMSLAVMVVMLLATAVTYKIPVVIVLMNNGVLGMVRQWQTLFFGKRYSSTVLERKTDFVALAKAFGLDGCVAETPVEFRKAFQNAVAGNKPFVIDVRIDKDEMVLPMLPPGGAISDIITKI